MLCSNNVSEELVSSSLRASPLMNLLFTPVDGRLKNRCTEVFQAQFRRRTSHVPYQVVRRFLAVVRCPNEFFSTDFN